MKFAVIGDIHSNKYALSSVLNHIKTQNVDTILSTGDLVGYLPYPNEVIDMLRAHHVFVVQGNHDEMIAQSESISKDQLATFDAEAIQKKASKIYTNYMISDENRTYLKQLPQTLQFKVSNKSVQVVHGSHRHIAEYLYADESLLMEIAPTVEADVLICGHTHTPYHLNVANVDFINVGSVGKPKTGDDCATYMLITIENNEVQSELVKVSYDLNQLIKDIENNPMISNELIAMLKEGY